MEFKKIIKNLARPFGVTLGALVLSLQINGTAFADKKEDIALLTYELQKVVAIVENPDRKPTYSFYNVYSKEDYAHRRYKFLEGKQKTRLHISASFPKVPYDPRDTSTIKNLYVNFLYAPEGSINHISFHDWNNDGKLNDGITFYKEEKCDDFNKQFYKGTYQDLHSLADRLHCLMGETKKEPDPAEVISAVFDKTIKDIRKLFNKR